MTSQQINSHRKEVNELKTQFEHLKQEIIEKLNRCSECIDSAEKLNQEASEFVRKFEGSSASTFTEAKLEATAGSVQGKIILDVGGDKYTTTVETLTKEKDSFFTKLFSSEYKLECDSNDKSIFVDRDGKVFAHILSYLRTGNVPHEVMSTEALRQKVIVEAKYYQTTKLVEILTEPERKEAERKAKFFNEGTLIPEEYQKQLIEFLDSTYTKSELIYKASRDAFDANAFHTKCNNQGPTLTIVRSSTGFVFGGFTTVPWSSNGNYQPDRQAFLFTLTNPHNIPPTKYSIKPTGVNAVFHHATYGPTFGAGHDLCILTNSNSANTSSTKFPNAYIDSTGYGATTLTGAINFMTMDIEVFKIM